MSNNLSFLPLAKGEVRRGLFKKTKAIFNPSLTLPLVRGGKNKVVDFFKISKYNQIVNS